MKKLILAAVVGASALSLAACNSEPAEEETVAVETEVPADDAMAPAADAMTDEATPAADATDAAVDAAATPAAEESPAM